MDIKVGFNKSGELKVFKDGKSVMKITLEEEHILFEGRYDTTVTLEEFHKQVEQEVEIVNTYKADFEDIHIKKARGKFIPQVEWERIRKYLEKEYIVACYYTGTHTEEVCQSAASYMMDFFNK